MAVFSTRRRMLQVLAAVRSSRNLQVAMATPMGKDSCCLHQVWSARGMVNLATVKALHLSKPELRLERCSQTFVLFSCLNAAIQLQQPSCRSMAGHSKWQNIRHIKAAKDADKSRIAQKVAQKIRIAVKEGGGTTDPKLNVALARALEDGQQLNVPSTTMEVALKKLEEKKEMGSLVVVEARGPGNCLLMIEAFTDKVARTRQGIQHVMKKFGGAIGNSGLANHAFQFRGVICVATGPNSPQDLEEATEIAIETGAEDVENVCDQEGDYEYRFLCDAKDVHQVKQELEARGLHVRYAAQDYLPCSHVSLSNDQLQLVAHLVEKLEDLEDVSRVFDNVDTSASDMPQS